MSDDDTNVAVLDALRRANPVPIDALAGRRDLPSAHALFAEITAQPPRRVQRRTVVVAIALVVLLLAAVLGAFALVDRADDPNPAHAPMCYETANLDARRAVASGPNLAEACAQVWRVGNFSGPEPKSFDRCLLESGAIAVFPGESGSVCERLGLRSVQTTPDAERVRKATDEVALAVGPPHCYDYEAASALTREILDKYNLDDWTIAAGDHPFSAKEPCASTAADAEAKTVAIQAIPDLHNPG